MATYARPRFSGESDSLLTFFVLAYALMWACFFTVAFAVSAKTAVGYGLLLGRLFRGSPRPERLELPT